MSRYIDADAYAAEMKTRQDACLELMNAAREMDNEEIYGQKSAAFSVFVEAKLTLDAVPTVDAVPVVFINDPFHVVYQAFKELYPDKECEILFDYNVETTDTHERVKGVTIFPDDGSIPQIRIDCEQTIDQISGILAHELAHVALGKPEWDDRELDHGEEFEKTLDAIFDRFNELQGFCADGERRTDG